VGTTTPGRTCGRGRPAYAGSCESTNGPLASEEAYLDTLEHAAQAGYDELVVYWPWPDTVPGDRFWTEPATVASAIARARADT
jgi:hypothetical protein